ncbi:thiamine-phosphate kinase [Moraxella caviae]|uniref:Thiamine-monophosphate kinase n=1 Tax=Moraxella caviae TaxID=34060 RepID=A0A1T0A1I9_9GAMM|nr:thiamine-phosphate kinase [Moraxella caviae]OOR89652.1 thiamine-phosphate kinase [Moraxella caviae]STZ10299.1 Thiamine-monophosphate kinase [Moraxella caviae]
MSEFSLIADYFSRHAPNDGLGVGDDCAIITPPANQVLVACADTLISGRHFPIDTAPHAIGYKAVAVNLSDLAAMGARPHSILLALSLPSMDKAWLGEFSRGLYEICDEFGVQLIGGDTTKSPTLTISVSAFGFMTADKAVKRSGAKIGDVICVSGQLGSAAFALQNPNSPLQHTLDYPVPQVALGQILADFAHAMIDVSDGLAQDLGHILTASDVGAELYLEQIPLHPLLQTLPFETAMRHALAGGDDYQLCFTISPDNLEKLKNKHPNLPIFPIGKITKTRTQHTLIQNNTQNTVQNLRLICYHKGEIFPINAAGFNHFD